MTIPPTPPPDQHVMQILLGKFSSRALTAAADLSIADQLAEGALSTEELAAKTESNADALYRVLRVLALVGIFEELPERRFQNNAASDLLRADVEGSMRAMVRWINDPAGWEPWGRLDHSIKTGRPAAEEVWGKNPFEWLKEHPSSLKAFQEAMTGFSAMTANAVTAAYDFSGIEKLVDVGGGHGMLLSMIIEKHTEIQGLLLDRPEVIAEARASLEGRPNVGQIELVAGDFFEAVPGGADAYILKHIIHDWSDELSVKILSNCREAMKPGGKILIAELVLVDGPEGAMGKFIDLEMLVMNEGGRERSEADFAALLQKAGLQLSRLVPTESPLGIVEAKAV